MKTITFVTIILSLFLLSACNVAPSEIQNAAKEPQVLSKTGYDISHLSPLELYVTQHEGTEPPFANKYWNNEEEGIYVSVVSGEPLFSSIDKYDSKTGWPSFTKPLADANFSVYEDKKLGYTRVEMKAGDGAHLGHIFEDGPQDKGGLRYCMNSASLEFIPLGQLEEEGLGEYMALFTNTTE